MSKLIERFFSAGSEPPPTAKGHAIREEIELRAHRIYVERGGSHGQDVEDWLQAERELLEKRGKHRLHGKSESNLNSRNGQYTN